MNHIFIPPKPPDINFVVNSPAAFEEVDDDSSSSQTMDFSNSISSDQKHVKKTKRKHSSKRHKPGCINENLVPNDSVQTTFNSVTSLNDLSPISQPSNSIPIQQSSPDKDVKIFYSENDKGPFVVHVQKRTVSSDNDYNTILNPIIFGKFIQKNNYRGIIPGSIIRIGRNRVKIVFNTFKDANTFVNNSAVSENGYNAFIPSFCVTKIGVIRVPIDIEDSDIIADSIFPNNPIKILKVRRLKYKVTVNDNITWKSSQSVVVTFEGQVLPEFLYLYYNKVNIELYKYPTIQCYSCCRFGHMKSNCRSKPRCYKCGQSHYGDSCGLDESEACCLLCSGSHYATSRKCPEYNRQQNIKSLMSQRSISYMEANKLEPRIMNKSFAEVASSGISYKKTVFAKPKIYKKNDNKSYDIDFHKNLLKDFQIPNPENGCALSKKSEQKSENTIKDLLSFIVELYNNNNLPDNVENIVINLLTSLKNGSSQNKNNSMELPKSSNKED